MRQPWRCFHCGTVIYTAGTDVCPNCDRCPYLRASDIPPRREPEERRIWKNIDKLPKNSHVPIRIEQVPQCCGASLGYSHTKKVPDKKLIGDFRISVKISYRYITSGPGV